MMAERRELLSVIEAFCRKLAERGA